MSNVFLKLVNLSISASYIVLAVLLLRVLFKKAPKWLFVVLWGIVALRLVFPFSIESVLSLLPSGETVSPDIMTDQTPSVNTGIPIINNTVNPIIGESFAPTPGDSANPLQIWIPVFTVVWLIGVASLLIYTVVSYYRLKSKVMTAVRLEENIFQSENVVSPFVLGVVKPTIYLPFDMDEASREHVIAHETAHIRRKDHLWKPLGFLLLAVYWFNPLMWVGYVLLCRDIELACDEKVIKALDHDARAAYSESLLGCSVNRRMIAACPLAFGEVGVKARVKSVLSYKKPAFWIIVAAIVASVALAICFLTVPPKEKVGETDPAKLTPEQIELMEKYPEYFGLDASNGLDVYVWQMAKHSYYFGILPRVDDSEKKEDDLLSLHRLKAVNAQQMRVILATYPIDENEVTISYWQNPLSSYIGDFGFIEEGEDEAAVKEKQKNFIEKVRGMLFVTKDMRVDLTDADYTVSLDYAAFAYSYVMNESSVPMVRIDDQNNLFDGSGKQLGRVYQVVLSQNDCYKIYGNDREKAEACYRNIKVAYKVIRPEYEAIDLYYVILQKDGSVLMVYGHYTNGLFMDEIRWTYGVTKD